MDILTALIVILIILWLLGVVALPSAGALIHILLVVVLVLVVLRLVQGRKIL